MEKFYSVGEVARLVGVTKRTIWRWVSTGFLPEPIHITRNIVRWPARQIDDWVKKLPSRYPRN